MATWLPDAPTWKLSDSAATRTHVPSTATASSFTGRDGHFICWREKPGPGPISHHYQSAWIKISVSIEYHSHTLQTQTILITHYIIHNLPTYLQYLIYIYISTIIVFVLLCFHKQLLLNSFPPQIQRF